MMKRLVNDEEVELTPEEEAEVLAMWAANAAAQEAQASEPAVLTPDEKLKAFFASNPDVRAYVSSTLPETAERRNPHGG